MVESVMKQSYPETCRSKWGFEAVSDCWLDTEWIGPQQQSSKVLNPFLSQLTVTLKDSLNVHAGKLILLMPEPAAANSAMM